GAALDPQRHVAGRGDAAEALHEAFAGQHSFAHAARLHHVQGFSSRSRPTMTSTTRNSPIQNVQYCGVICETKSCSSLKTIAPAMPPYSQPVPPITSISMTSAERWNSN